MAVNSSVAVVPLGLGLGAALLLGLGFVLQQRIARRLPHGHALSVRLFGDLVREPLWVLGVATMIGGQLLGAAALGAGDVTLIEPLLTTNLLFALVIARVLSDQPMGARGWIGAIVLVAGVVVFLVTSSPTEVASAADPEVGRRGMVSLVLVAVMAVASVLVARRSIGRTRAAVLAGGAGLLFGVQDGMTRAAMDSLSSGIVRLLATWTSYAVVVAAVAGLLLLQSAFEAAPLRASLPVVSAVEPLTGIGYGIGVFGEQVRLGPGWLAGEAAGIVVIIAGVVLLARSHALVSHPGAS